MIFTNVTMEKYVIRVISLLFISASVPAGTVFLLDGPADSADQFPVFVTDELMWDSGRRSYSLCWYEGRDNWLAVDFDASEISTTPVITKIRVYTRDDWPNEGYDGFKVAIFPFEDDEPGPVESPIWPENGEPHLFEPTGLPHGDVWADIQVGWTSPSYLFVVAINQYYDEPNCDPLALDDEVMPSEHNWMCINKSWEPFDPSSLNIEYENIMIRVEVQGSGTEHSITPASLGRIKTLYR
jgi:hypothetical protein